MASQPAPVTDLRLEHGEDEPIVFYGPPTRLRGTLRLHNRSTEKLKLPMVALDLPKLRGPAKQPLDVLPMFGRVYANQQTRVPAVLNLDPSTPPGTYDGSLQIAGRRQPVRLHVTERIDLRFEPTDVSLFTEGTLVFTRDFVAENAGNVPLRLGEECVVPLGDTADLQAAVRRGLRGACDAEKKSEDVIKSLLCAWSQQQVGTVSIKREDITLQPGETRPATVTFSIPDDLQPFRRYVTHLPLYNAALRLEVVTGQFKSGRRSEKRSQS